MLAMIDILLTTWECVTISFAESMMGNEMNPTLALRMTVAYDHIPRSVNNQSTHTEIPV